MKRTRIVIIAIIACVALFATAMSQNETETTAENSDTAEVSPSFKVPVDFNDLPVKGVVTMIDLGAKKCVPCKMMAPILKKMETAYKDTAAIVFIDVWEHREQARRFGIRAIPTQIFYDQDGKEVYRHKGFMSEKAIVEQLTRMGVEKPAL